MRVLATSLLIVAVVAAGCESPSLSPSPTTSTPPQGASPPPSAGPTETPEPLEPAPSAPTATAEPSSSPQGAMPLTVHWRAADLAGIDPAESIVEVVRSGDTYVMVTSLPYREEASPSAAAWWSGDGVSWELGQAFPPGDLLFDLTAGGPGFVASGFSDERAIIWTSADGRAWEPVVDDSLGDAVIGTLVTTDSGVVGFGSEFDGDRPGIWTSADGIEWLAATNPSGMTVARGLEAVGAYDGRAVAFVDEGDDAPPSIWETTGRAEWTRTGELREDASITSVTGGARGWVALGSNRAWTSDDGVRWSRGFPGPDVDADVVVDNAGFIAVGWVGSLPGETCGDQRPFAGLTWTSSDGRTWDRMRVTRQFRDAMVTQLLVVDRTLVGYGQRIDPTGDDTLPVDRWTATLPEIASPADASDEATEFRGCGG